MLGLEVASSHAIALVVARLFLGAAQDTEYGFVFFMAFALPVIFVFWAASSLLILRAAGSGRPM